MQPYLELLESTMCQDPHFSDEISGRVIHDTKPAPTSHQLKKKFEMEQGYGKPRKEVKGLVEKVSREKGVLKKSKVSNGWLRRFLERNFERHFERQPVLTL